MTLTPFFSSFWTPCPRLSWTFYSWHHRDLSVDSWPARGLFATLFHSWGSDLKIAAMHGYKKSIIYSKLTGE